MRSLVTKLAVMAGVSLSAALVSGAALAQQGQAPPDPFGGRFGVMEMALPGDEALRQVDVLSKQLAALAPQRPGVVDTYVLSMSLFDDPVFEHEASEAAAILARRFDAQDRTVVLSVGEGRGAPRTLAAPHPNNIGAVISKFSKLIDRKEDLVVIFLTSHGAPDGAAAIQERPRMFGAFRPQHMREILEQANIPTRMVIVSACFSGAFVPMLQGSGSVVLTAASAERTSFGCQPENEWTYFGDALFNRAMRGGAPTLDAFDEAAGTIRKWEDKLMAEWDARPAALKAREPRPLYSEPQKDARDPAAGVVAKAEEYGRAVSCSGVLTFALDRVRTGRALKGVTAPGPVDAARAAAQARAIDLGTPRGRAVRDTGKAISEVSLETTKLFQFQADDVAARAAQCVTLYGPAPATAGQ